MKGFILAAATAATMLVGGAAQAVTFTYGQYLQTGQNGQSVAFTNNGGATPSGTLSNNGAQTVKFQFFDDPSDNVTLPASLTSSQDATFYFNALTTTAASVATAGPPVATQSFDSGTISFTGTGDLAGKNLLTINFTNLWLTGIIGGNSATTITTTPYSTLNITSAFFDFSSVNASNFTLSMSATIPNLSQGANGVLSSFSADSSGTFASDPAPIYVPEPGMLGLFGFGAIGLGFARRRKS